MALHTKKDFADLCGLRTNTLATYVGRGKVVVRADNMVDDKDPVNKAFLQHRKGKESERQVIARLKKISGASDDVLNEINEAPPLLDENGSEDESGIPEVGRSMQRLMHLKADTQERENKKRDYDLAKKQGEIIPTELVKPIFTRHNQYILTQMHNATEDILRDFGKVKDFTHEEIATMRGRLIETLNKAIREAVDLSMSAVGDIINEFKIKRGVGERGAV